jgi:hypothetical protein
VFEVPIGVLILVLYLPILLTFFMVGETLLGLLSVALAVAGAGIALVFELRKGRGDINDMLNFLKNSTRSTIDEKIAVLYSYANNVPTWKDKTLDPQLMERQILSDISSIARVTNNIGYSQWREVLKVLMSLIESMDKAGYDTIVGRT